MNKRNAPSSGKPASTDLDSIGGGLALNFINTLRADSSGAPFDTLQSDRDVRRWMRKMGFAARCTGMSDGELLRRTRQLRSIALAAVQQRKAAGRVDLSPLNRLLRNSPSHLTLAHTDGGIVTRREYDADSAEQCLAPITEAVADLLASSEFVRVHQCAGTDCVLWFTDRSKGHRRRFCTEEGCGTRARVAAFRARKAKSESI